MVTLILFVLIFGVVVISHEFGHFLLAKANGIHVIEFSVGMGPNLFSFQKGDTKYSLKLLPIGGACMFEGEDGLNEKEDGEDHSGSFLNANAWSFLLRHPFRTVPSPRRRDRSCRITVSLRRDVFCCRLAQGSGLRAVVLLPVPLRRPRPPSRPDL